MKPITAGQVLFTVVPISALILAGCGATPQSTQALPAAKPARIADVTPSIPVPPPPPAPAERSLGLRRIDPSLLNLSPGVAEVVKLSQAGVDASVITAFIDSSTNAFNPTLEEVVYLNDMGVPQPVLTALLQRAKLAREKLAKEAAEKPVAEPKRKPVEPPAQPPAPVPAPPEVPVLVEAPPAPPPVIYEVPVGVPVEVGYFYPALQAYGSWLQLPRTWLVLATKCGNHERRLATVLRPGDVGSIRTAAGTGNQIIPGAGRRFIMGAGSSIRSTDGSGPRILLGDRPGSVGDHTRITPDGRRCHRGRIA